MQARIIMLIKCYGANGNGVIDAKNLRTAQRYATLVINRHVFMQVCERKQLSAWSRSACCCAPARGYRVKSRTRDGRHLNDEQRWKIVHLSKIAFQTPTAIARKVGCSRETVYATLRKYSITGTTKDRPHRGRKRKLSVTDEQSIVNRAKTGMGAKEIAQKMGKDVTDIGQKHKTPRVSASTVQRVLKAQEYAYLKVLQHEALTEAHKQKRLQYANDYRNYDWCNVLFSDEKTFCLGTAPTRCWQKPGQRVTRAVSRHPSKLHVWGAVLLSALSCMAAGPSIKQVHH
jgi:transposase